MNTTYCFVLGLTVSLLEPEHLPVFLQQKHKSDVFKGSVCGFQILGQRPIGFTATFAS